jgi:hypothetical protein
MWRSGVPDRAARALGSRGNPGAPVVAIIVLRAGDPAGGRAAMAALDALGESVVDHIGEIDYTDLQQIIDPGAPAGHRDYFKGGFTRTLSDDAVADLADLGRDMRAPLTQIICAPLGAHTAYAAVDETHSAIGHRDEEWSFQVLSLWADPAQDAEQKAWTKAAAERMSSYGGMVSYPNFLTADDAADVEAAYSPAGDGTAAGGEGSARPGQCVPDQQQHHADDCGGVVMSARTSPVARVTGGASGIGAAIVQACLRTGIASSSPISTRRRRRGVRGARQRDRRRIGSACGQHFPTHEDPGVSVRLSPADATSAPDRRERPRRTIVAAGARTLVSFRSSCLMRRAASFRSSRQRAWSSSCLLCVDGRILTRRRIVWCSFPLIASRSRW